MGDDGEARAAEVLPMQRQRQVLEAIEKKGWVTAREIAATLGVSSMTARRYLNALAKRGLVLRVHGGAVLPDRGLWDEPIRQKQRVHVQAKRRIAQAAAAVVTEGQTVILDAGTTTAAVARVLRRQVRQLTVITSDLEIARMLADDPSYRVLCVGGLVQPKVLAVVGHLAVQFMQSFRAHHAFIGTDAFDVEAGVTTRTLEKVPLKQAMVSAASVATLVADSSKLGRVLPARVLPLSSFHRVVTDRPQDPRTLKALHEAAQRDGFELIVV